MSTRLLPAVTVESVAPVRDREGWPDSANRTVHGSPPESWSDLLAICEAAGPAPIAASSDHPIAHRLTNGGPVVWLIDDSSAAETIGTWIKDRMRTATAVRMIAPSASDRANLREDLAGRGVRILDLTSDATTHSAEWWLERWACLWDRGVRVAAQKAADFSTRVARWRADSRRLGENSAVLGPISAALTEAEADLAIRRQRAEIRSEQDRLQEALDRPNPETPPPPSWWRRILGLAAPKPPDLAAMRSRSAELEGVRLKLPPVSGEDDAIAEAKTSALRQALRGLTAPPRRNLLRLVRRPAAARRGTERTLGKNRQRLGRDMRRPATSRRRPVHGPPLEPARMDGVRSFRCACDPERLVGTPSTSTRRLRGRFWSPQTIRSRTPSRCLPGRLDHSRRPPSRGRAGR